MQGLADIVRAAEHGIRSVLIADLGLLAAFQQMRVERRAAGRHAGEAVGAVPGHEPGHRARAGRLGANTLNISAT